MRLTLRKSQVANMMPPAITQVSHDLFEASIHPHNWHPVAHTPVLRWLRGVRQTDPARERQLRLEKADFLTQIGASRSQLALLTVDLDEAQSAVRTTKSETPQPPLRADRVMHTPCGPFAGWCHIRAPAPVQRRLHPSVLLWRTKGPLKLHVREMKDCLSLAHGDRFIPAAGRLSRMQSKKQQLVNHLDTVNGTRGIRQVVDFVAANRAKFRSEVYGPIIAEVSNISSPMHAAMLEQSVRGEPPHLPPPLLRSAPASARPALSLHSPTLLHFPISRKALQPPP